VALCLCQGVGAVHEALRWETGAPSKIARAWLVLAPSSVVGAATN